MQSSGRGCWRLLWRLVGRSGRDVHFLANTDYQVIRDHGLKVDSKGGDFHLDQVHVYSNANAMPKCDVVVICLKSTKNVLLNEILPPLVHPGSVVVVLQNGLDVESEADKVMHRLVGENRVIGGCCFLCSNKIAPGHIRHLDYGRIIVGKYRSLACFDQAIAEGTRELECLETRELSSGESSSAQSPQKTFGNDSLDNVLSVIVNHFRDAQIEIESTDDLVSARWNKLAWNIPYNGLSVILNASTLI